MQGHPNKNHMLKLKTLKPTPTQPVSLHSLGSSSEFSGGVFCRTLRGGAVVLAAGLLSPLFASLERSFLSFDILPLLVFFLVFLFPFFFFLVGSSISSFVCLVFLPAFLVFFPLSAFLLLSLPFLSFLVAFSPSWSVRFRT